MKIKVKLRERVKIYIGMKFICNTSSITYMITDIEGRKVSYKPYISLSHDENIGIVSLEHVRAWVRNDQITILADD